MKARRKLVCVIGLGQFGSEIARELAKGADVLAIDTDEGRVSGLSDDVQRALCLDARDFGALSSLVSADFDVGIVSMGRSLESSILATLHLARLGVKEIHAKALNDDHATILSAVGATSVVFAEREVAHRLAGTILHANLLDYVPLGEDYRVMDLEAPEGLYGLSLLELRLRQRFGVFVLAVKRKNPDKFVFLPGPDFKVKADDSLVLIGREADMVRVQSAGSTLVPS